MDKSSSTVCILIAALCALVHFGTGEFFFNVFLFFSVKPGVCPHRRFDNIMCGEFCSNDSDCPDNEKCCFSGCGHQCMAPYTGLHMCTEYYYRDGQGPGHQTCCRTTCDYTCSELCCQSIKKHH
uniref:WAP domain-containing protein n=1 Tax=Maylandia zebra TaxID=106582 RepID=A0A3P9CYR9_9CICH